MAANTTALIKALRERVNKILTTYYEEAPSKDAVFPYAVINGVNIIDLAAGDLASFYLDIWVDEKQPTATEQLESLCDTLRNELTGAVIAESGVFALFSFPSFFSRRGGGGAEPRAFSLWGVAPNPI